MDGLYLYCQVCNNYVAAGNCGCGWTNRYLKDEQPLLEDIAM